MKKFFTLAASLLVLSANAQTVKNLDSSLVFYLTNDTVSTQMGIYEDPDTGEEVEGLVARPWNGASCVSAFNACGIGLESGTDDFGLNITVKNKYTDPENGFTIPAGVYRGVTLNRARLTLAGALNDGSKFTAFTNVKSMILYFIPVPTTWVSGGISLQDFPTGRASLRPSSTGLMPTTAPSHRSSLFFMPCSAFSPASSSTGWAPRKVISGPSSYGQ